MLFLTQSRIKYYGIVVRNVTSGVRDSNTCGQLIRAELRTAIARWANGEARWLAAGTARAARDALKDPESSRPSMSGCHRSNTAAAGTTCRWRPMASRPALY